MMLYKYQKQSYLISMLQLFNLLIQGLQININSIRQNIRKMKAILEYEKYNQKELHSKNFQKSSSLDYSRLIKRKPQSKLSYLKKLFSSKKQELNEKNSSINLRLKICKNTTQEENVIKENSKIINLIQNDNNLQHQRRDKYSVLQDEEIVSKDHMIKRYRQNQLRVLLSNQNERSETIDQNKRKRTTFVKSLKKQNAKRKIVVQDGQKSEIFGQSQQMKKGIITVKSRSQQNVKHKIKGKGNHQNFLQKQNMNLIKQEVRSLKKIDRMLKKVKYEIIKNRSILISGLHLLDSTFSTPTHSTSIQSPYKKNIQTNLQFWRQNKQNKLLQGLEALDRKNVGVMEKEMMEKQRMEKEIKKENNNIPKIIYKESKFKKQ